MTPIRSAIRMERKLWITYSGEIAKWEVTFDAWEKGSAASLPIV